MGEDARACKRASERASVRGASRRAESTRRSSPWLRRRRAAEAHQRLAEVEALALGAEIIVEVGPLHELLHDERAREVLHARADEADQVGMAADAGENGELEQQALVLDAVALHAVLEHLDGAGAAAIGSLIDDAELALTQFFYEANFVG